MSKCIDAATDFEIGYAIGFLSAKKDTFSTIEVIRKICGSYLNDTGMSPGSSPNARFGKNLSEKKLDYRIQLVSTDNSDVDDSGKQTTTAI